MCIICVKEAGAKAPDKKVFERMFDHNPDGAGYMYADGDSVRIKKGFMDFGSFWKAYQKDKKKERAFVFHFRIATHGGINQAMTQPFPLSEKTKAMRRLQTMAGVGIAHNGIISMTTKEARTVSDTAVFIKKYASLLLDASKPKTEALELIAEAISPSRMAIMYPDGTVYRLGAWKEEGGLYYSNDSYKPREVKFAPVYSVPDIYIPCDDCKKPTCFGCDYYSVALDGYEDSALDWD